jgi:hypothetical protein
MSTQSTTPRTLAPTPLAPTPPAPAPPPPKPPVPAPFVTKPILTAQEAIGSHVRWLITLQLAVKLRESLTPRCNHAIRHPAECAIGEWLLSADLAHLHRTPEHLALSRLHKLFHHEMLQIATLINAADFEAAARLLNDPNGAFQNSAKATANAITTLGRTYKL